MRSVVIGVRRWVIVATLLVAFSSGIGVAIGTWRPVPQPAEPVVVQVRTIVHDLPVPPTPPCRDDAVMQVGPFYKQCDSRARLEIYPGRDWTLYKCVCVR